MTENSIHKGNQFSKIVKKGSWYAFATLVMKITSFLLLPIITRYLTPADYGAIGTLNSVAMVLPFLIGLQLTAAFNRYYFEDENSAHVQVAALFSTHLWFTVVWGSFIVFVALLFGYFWLDNVAKVEFFPAVPLALIPPLLNEVAQSGAALLQANLKTKKISAIRIVAHFIDLSVIAVLLIPMDMGLVAKLAGPAAASVVNLSWLLFEAGKADVIKFKFSKPILSRSLKFSLPLLPGSATVWINTLSDRLILANFGPISQVGLYSFSAQIAHLLYVLIDATSKVQMPIGMSSLTENIEQGKEQISQFLSFYIWTTIPCFLALTLLSKELVTGLMDPGYHSAYKLVGVLAFPFILGGLYRPFLIVLSFHGKTGLISFASIISAIINLILNLLFIPEYGQFAAAWTSVVSVIVYSGWLIFWSQKISPIRINWKIIGPSISVGAVVFSIYLFLELSTVTEIWRQNNIFLFAFIKISLLACYGFVTLFFKEIRNGVLRHTKNQARGL